MSKKRTIITASLTGAITPAGYDIPATPKRIAEDVYTVWKAGAAIVHLHMRDDQGLGTMDAAKFKETIRLIRSKKDCDVIINCTSSGDPRANDEERMLHMRTIDGIEMGSFDAGSFNWMPGGLFVNTPAFLQELADVYIQRGIKPEIEIFDTGMLGITDFYIKKGKLATPCNYQFCLGIPGGMPATVENLLYLKEHIPNNSIWSAFGVGAGHMPILYAAIALGGSVRVGMEDNVIFGIDENGDKIKATNAMLVKRAADAVRTFGNEPATPAEAREILGIPAFNGEAVRKKLSIE